MLRVELEPGFVLHHRPFRDTSLVVEAFTRGHGRVGLVARAARGPRSRFRGVLQPFRPLLLSWRLGGELGTLLAAEATAPPPSAGGGERWLALYYASELVLRLTGRLDPHADLFDAYTVALHGITRGERTARALRVFEKRLLDSLGYGLDFVHDADGQPVEPSGWYRFEAASGLVRSREGVPGALRGASMAELASETLESAEALVDARRLLRSALEVHLGDRPLRSRELLARLSRA